MKITKIIESQNSKTGYSLIVIDENEIIENHEINDTDPKNENILKLPENPSNRKWFSINKIIKNGGEIELSYKESIKLGESGQRKSLNDYLTEEEKKIIEDIMNKAKERKEEDKKKPMSEKEKLLARIEKYKKMLENLGDED